MAAIERCGECWRGRMKFQAGGMNAHRSRVRPGLAPSLPCLARPALPFPSLPITITVPMPLPVRPELVEGLCQAVHPLQQAPT